MVGHGSPPPEDRANHPGRQVGRPPRTDADWAEVSRQIRARNPSLTFAQTRSRKYWDEDWGAEGEALNRERD